MISKGNQRGGGRQLAAHLLNAHDNERIELAEVRGAVADDIHGAFAEWSAQAKATCCAKYLYSLSVNPDQRQGHLTRAQYFEFLGRVEQSLGLQGQGRVVVFHWKVDKGGVAREHCHAVWSRIDCKAMRALHISYDRMQLRAVIRAFAKDHGLQLPAGLRQDRGEKRYEARAAHSNHREKQQEERSGLTKEERQKAIGSAWATTSNGAAFLAALSARGFTVAIGDRRTFVVIDPAGEIHSLARQLAGISMKTLKERLGPAVTLMALPTLAEAKERVSRVRALSERISGPALSASVLDERRAGLRDAQARRREPLDRDRVAMETRHAEEKESLRDLQREEKDGMASDRRARRRTGFVAILYRITGFEAMGNRQHRKKEHSLDSRHLAQRVELERRHGAERAEIERKYRATKTVEKREQRSLEVKFKREKSIALAAKLRMPDVLGPHFTRAAQPNVPLPGSLPRPDVDEARGTRAVFNRVAALPEEDSKRVKELLKDVQQSMRPRSRDRDFEL